MDQSTYAFDRFDWPWDLVHALSQAYMRLRKWSCSDQSPLTLLAVFQGQMGKMWAKQPSQNKVTSTSDRWEPVGIVLFNFFCLDMINRLEKMEWMIALGPSERTSRPIGNEDLNFSPILKPCGRGWKSMNIPARHYHGRGIISKNETGKAELVAIFDRDMHRYM